MVDITTECPYNNLDMNKEEIRRILEVTRLEIESVTQDLKDLSLAKEAYENMLTRAESASLPPISLRAAILQVLRESKGEPLHVKEVLQQVEALGAHVRSANNDKVSRVDVGIYGLKRQGLPVERVRTRTWKYLGGDSINFRTERARKKRQRRNDTVANELDEDSMTGGEAKG